MRTALCVLGLANVNCTSASPSACSKFTLNSEIFKKCIDRKRKTDRNFKRTIVIVRSPSRNSTLYSSDEHKTDGKREPSTGRIEDWCRPGETCSEPKGAVLEIPSSVTKKDGV